MKFSNDLVSNDIEVTRDKCGKLNIMIEGPCPGTCDGCRDRAQDGRVFSGAGVQLGKNTFPDVDKVIADVTKTLHAQAVINQQEERPSLQDYFDKQRTHKEEPPAVPQKKLSPTEVLEEGKSIRRALGTITEWERQEAEEQFEKGQKEIQKIIQMIKQG